MKALPEALAELMKLRNMNATALAAASGVTDATVSYYLSGKRGRVIEDPDVQVTLSRFSEVLGVPMTYWFEYRLFQVGEVFRRRSDLEGLFYNQIMDLDADLSEQEADGLSAAPERGGPKRTRRDRSRDTK